jgi:hypothetical protein
VSPSTSSRALAGVVRVPVPVPAETAVLPWVPAALPIDPAPLPVG